MEGDGTSQDIDAQSVDLDAVGAVIGAQAEVTFTPNATGDTMALATGTWASLGFAAGGLITVTGDANAANDGTFTIASISSDGSTLTLTVSNVLTSEQNAEVEVENGPTGNYAAGNYQGQVTFANSSTGDTLTLPDTGPTWAELGFLSGIAMAGDAIVVSGASETANDASFTIASVSGYTLTLQQSYVLSPETESDVSVSNGMIGLVRSANSTSTASSPIDLYETNDFTATTTNGSIYLSLGSSVDSTAVDVVAGGTGNVSVTSSASSLTIENITANGATVAGTWMLGGTAAVDASEGSLLESGSPGTITAQIVSLTSAENLGTSSSPFLTSAVSGVTVDETATSPSSPSPVNVGGAASPSSVFLENTSSLASVGVSTDDGTVAISYQNNGTTTPLLSFSNNQLSETLSATESAIVTFANTDTNGGTADNVDVRGTINALSISAGGQILAVVNANALLEDTVLSMLTLSADNGIGNQATAIDTEVMGTRCDDEHGEHLYRPTW